MSELLTVREVATALKISPRQVWKLLASEQLPSPLKLSRSVRWRAGDISRFIDLGCPRREVFEAAISGGKAVAR